MTLPHGCVIPVKSRQNFERREETSLACDHVNEIEDMW